MFFPQSFNGFHECKPWFYLHDCPSQLRAVLHRHRLQGPLLCFFAIYHELFECIMKCRLVGNKSKFHDPRVGSSELKGLQPRANTIVAFINGLLTCTPHNINWNMDHPTNCNSELIFEVNTPFRVGRRCSACPYSALENASMHICTWSNRVLYSF